MRPIIVTMEDHILVIAHVRRLGREIGLNDAQLARAVDQAVELLQRGVEPWWIRAAMRAWLKDARQSRQEPRY